MTINWTDRLSEYLDGSLLPDEAAACEAWLASSAEGRMLLAELRAVIAKAKTLPDVAVPASIWSGVASAIHASKAGGPGATQIVAIDPARRAGVVPSRRWSISLIQFAAAAAVILAVGIAAGLGLRARNSGEEIAQRPELRPLATTGAVAIPVAQRAEVSYDKAVQELQLILDRNRSTLDTSTVRVLEKSLASIDTALAEAQRALAGDPHNAYLNDHLTRIKRKKLDLLRQGASLVQAS